MITQLCSFDPDLTKLQGILMTTSVGADRHRRGSPTTTRLHTACVHTTESRGCSQLAVLGTGCVPDYWHGGCSVRCITSDSLFTRVPRGRRIFLRVQAREALSQSATACGDRQNRRRRLSCSQLLQWVRRQSSGACIVREAAASTNAHIRIWHGLVVATLGSQGDSHLRFAVSVNLRM